MKRETIVRIIQKRLSKISLLCTRINKDFDAAAIHKFRVQVKKLRALLRLIKYTDPNAPTLGGKFKNLYQIAGNIRDNTLAIEQITARKIYVPQYLDFLTSDLAFHKKQWHLHFSTGILEKQEQKLTGYDYRSLSSGDLKHFLHHNIDTIQSVNESVIPPNDRIHSQRKAIKDIIGLAAVTENEWTAAQRHIKKMPQKELESLADIIGRFNDDRLMIERMNKFSAQHISAAEKNTIDTLCNEEATLLSEEKKHIRSITNDLLETVKHR